MPSTNTTRRRHSKQPSGSSKKTAPSVISTNSLKSASNNATVKQYSIFPSSLRPSKRPGAEKVLVERPEQHHKRSNSVNDSNKENVDVFAYIVKEGDKQDDKNSEDEENEQDQAEEEDEEGEEEEEEEEQEEKQYVNSTKEEKDAEDIALAAQARLSSSSSSASLADPPLKSPRYSDLEVRGMQDSVQRTWGRASLHSDSGISVRSSSPDQDSPVLHHKLATVLDEPTTEIGGHGEFVEGYGPESLPDPADPCSAFGHKRWPSLQTIHNFGPEAYYSPAPPRLIQTADNDSHQMPDLCPLTTDQIMKHASRPQRPTAKASRLGYDYLASNIGSRDDALLKPIYRKFEMLNHRMLLYLQDEIAEMEDQLREYDAAIASEERAVGTTPASRRAEARLPSRLHWHRVDLLNRSFAKVEQYNRALTSYSKLTKSLEPASHADVNAYRGWIRENAPIVGQETAFLQKESDLLSISVQKQKPLAKINFRAGSALETPVIVVAFGLLSTIIVFKVVPQVLARLVISVMVGIAALCTLSPEVMTNVKGVKNWKKTIATYSLIMLVLAVVVS